MEFQAGSFEKKVDLIFEKLEIKPCGLGSRIQCMEELVLNFLNHNLTQAITQSEHRTQLVVQLVVKHKGTFPSSTL